MKNRCHVKYHMKVKMNGNAKILEEISEQFKSVNSYVLGPRSKEFKDDHDPVPPVKHGSNSSSLLAHHGNKKLKNIEDVFILRKNKYFQ
uniref:Uncharacterized protein n=1 Tax=Ciona intestinalis TaxID=7719 RepID=F6X0E4_CIOIN